jgi:hypothetical protein
MCLLKYIPMLGIALLAGCSASGPGALIIPPPGWEKETIQAPTKGIEVLFAAKRTEAQAGTRHLIVLHAPEMTARQGVRGTIGAYLDAFWKKDPQLFLAIKLQGLEIEGRNSFRLQLSGDDLNPPHAGNLHTYFFMTEAGLYQVTYTTEGKPDFDLQAFLKDSFQLRAKESNFAQDLIAEYIKEFPTIQAEERKRLAEKSNGHN